MAPATHTSSRLRRRLLLAGFLLLASVVRLPDVWRPIDGSTWAQWRESDIGAIARSFYREDPNILHPRIDWRGDGPGLVESEFPLYPWVVSLVYRAFGYHEELARVVTFFISLGSAFVFFLLASRLLPPLALPVALVFYALNPLATMMGSAVQPEPLMMLFLLLAVLTFLRWLDEERSALGVVAALSTAMAILAKAPAAHLGLLFAALCLERFGWRAVLRPGLWLFATASLVPAVGWYAFAHQYWVLYGNTLGISNEAGVHIVSGDFLGSLTRLLPGLGYIELGRKVWTVPGALLAATALPAVATRSGRVVLYWAGALAIYFLVTIGTTGEPWAFYYHIVSVPVAALAIGLAFDLHVRPALEARRPTLQALVVSGLLLSALVLQGRELQKQTHPDHWAVDYACSQQFVQHIPPGTLIAASGGPDFDEWGNPNAGDAPHYFFWMDRFGFSVHEPAHTLERLEALRQRGVRYFVLERDALRGAPAGFEQEMRSHHRLESECEVAMLFALRPATHVAAGPTAAPPADP